MKTNCWNFKDCGQYGICPATKERKLDGVHGGINAGRACWIIADTLCLENESRIENYCTTKCNFYSVVKKEENYNFKEAIDLLSYLKN